jgi:purine-cytosine permease-like protein
MAVSAARNEQLRRYVENRHIDHIPAGARYGKPWHQFAFWFGGNVNVFNVVLGAVTVSIGLTFWWALIAIAAGTLTGALLIALHATQGPGSASRSPSRAGDSSGSTGPRSCSPPCCCSTSGSSPPNWSSRPRP